MGLQLVAARSFSARVLLFGSFSTLGRAGYLACSISHYDSMASRLAVFAVYGLERRNFVFGATAALAVCIDAIFDPSGGAADRDASRDHWFHCGSALGGSDALLRRA
jgi:hypothetical protein